MTLNKEKTLTTARLFMMWEGTKTTEGVKGCIANNIILNPDIFVISTRLSFFAIKKTVPARLIICLRNWSNRLTVLITEFQEMLSSIKSSEEIPKWHIENLAVEL